MFCTLGTNGLTQDDKSLKMTASPFHENLNHFSQRKIMIKKHIKDTFTFPVKIATTFCCQTAATLPPVRRPACWPDPPFLSTATSSAPRHAPPTLTASFTSLSAAAIPAVSGSNTHDIHIGWVHFHVGKLPVEKHWTSESNLFSFICRVSLEGWKKGHLMHTQPVGHFFIQVLQSRWDWERVPRDLWCARTASVSQPGPRGQGAAHRKWRISGLSGVARRKSWNLLSMCLGRSILFKKKYAPTNKHNS